LAIDGPAYLTQKAEAELAKDQASSAVGTDTAGQPHDDGNGLAIDPNTVPVRPAKAQLTITPSTINVVAKGVGVVPGAIVCADLDAVDLVYGWYSDNWTDPRRGCFHEWSGPADPRRQYSLAGALPEAPHRLPGSTGATTRRGHKRNHHGHLYASIFGFGKIVADHCARPKSCSMAVVA
jgi:hypothetical protein